MFVRRTTTRSRLDGAAYFTYRLVRTERIGGRVKQVTLLNLGRHFDLDRSLWPEFCARLSELIAPQGLLEPIGCSSVVEAVAQRYAAVLRPREQQAPPVAERTPVAQRPQAAASSSTAASSDASPWQSVDTDSLECLDLRTAGVEALALHALDALGVVDVLRTQGLDRVSLAAAVGQIVARMAHPASERATHHWLQHDSALGELYGYDYQKMSLHRLYRVADRLLPLQEKLESALYSRLDASLGLKSQIALYDLTNTYFEGLAGANPSARRGHSKEKRSDAPLLTLALVLDGEGFVRRSQVFAGNVNERSTLATMLSDLKAAAGSLVVLDRGIVTQANLDWLKANDYRYLVMSRQRCQLEQPQILTTASDAPIQWQQLPDQDDGEIRLACHSPARAEKEAAMTALARRRLEAALDQINAGLSKPRSQKQPKRLWQRIGRLKQRYSAVAQHYQIELTPDPNDANKIIALNYSYAPDPASKAALPGHYVLRSNATELPAETLWRTYIQLTDVEAAFRSLKSELGLRPIYHHLERRCQAHLWISVLAYQCVQWLRRQLKAAGIDASWHQLRKTLQRHQRVTVSFNTAQGGRLHVRKSATPSAAAAAIYDALGLPHKPGKVTKRTFRPERDL
jgi:transposase